MPGTPTTFYVTDGNPLHPAMVIGYFYTAQIQDNGGIIPNQNDRLFFHWNPTSYTFKKSTEYDPIPTKGFFIESLQFKQSNAIVCSFELFLNEWDQQRQIQMSCEASIGWLISRMMPAPSSSPNVPGQRGSNWLNLASSLVARGTDQLDRVPVLILMGLRDPFTCVLTDVEIVSAIQRPNTVPRPTQKSAVTQALTKAAATGSAIQQAALQRTAGSGTQPFNRKYFQATAPKPGDIVRATVKVTLKEWVPSST